MFLLWRLILAHFIGDTIFQPDEIYEIKKNRFAGVVLHAAIIFFTFLIFSWPYLQLTAVWLIIFFAAFVHLWQDELKIRRQIPAKHNFIFFIIDQILHIFCLVPVIFVDGTDLPASGNGLMAALYNHPSLVHYGIVFVGVVFLGAYVWESFKVSYLPKTTFCDPRAMKYGMFERSLLLASLGLGAWWYLLVPVGFRIFYKQLKLSWFLVFNIFLSCIGALILYQLPPLF